MAHDFLEPDRDQLFLLPPSLRDWVPADHEVWFLIDLVDGLDLAAFEASYRLGRQGRAAVSPRMLLTLLIYAYSRGVESSRAIERACVEDVVFRVICGNDAPDHTTIARFRQRHEAAFKDLFVQVLGLCARAGMVQVGVVAVDGTKMAANASLGANRDVDRLRRQVAEIVERASEVDAAEDEQFGERRGDELPAELADPARRKARIAELLAEAEAEQRRRVNLTDPESRIMSSTKGFVQGYNAQVVAGPGEVILAAEVTSDENDLSMLIPMLDALDHNLAAVGVEESVGVVLADAGYYSVANLEACEQRGVDALIATGKRHRVGETTPDPWVAYDAEQAAIDAEQAAERQRRAAIFERVAAGAPITDVLSQLGVSQAVAYDQFALWRRGGVDALRVRRRRGLPRPLSSRRRHDHEAKMAQPENQQLYKQRAHLAETIFAERKHNRRATHFARRGLDAARSQWIFQAAAHNALRLRAALTALLGPPPVAFS